MSLIVTTKKWYNISSPLSFAKWWGSFIRKSKLPATWKVRKKASNRWITFCGSSWNCYRRTRVCTVRWVILPNERCYTPKHFSKVIKQACGRTPLDLINETTVEHIKYRLKRSEKSIKEIAEEFNFPNQSFFGKYVKAHLGTSPANYRNRKEEWQKEQVLMLDKSFWGSCSS